MRRDTQLWLAGSIVVAISLASVVVLQQRDQLSQQQQAIEQQNLQAKAFKDSSDEADRLQRQEQTFALQLKTLDAEQAKNAATASANQASQAVTDQQAQERQRLEGQIQDLKTQRAKLAHQADCNQTQSRMRLAEQAGDSGQAKALQDRWNANCAS
jgi:uncharacterized membrane protein YhiD involved in acid resistance